MLRRAAPGENTSGSFEQPIRRGKGTAQYGCDFGKGGWGRWNQALFFFFKKDFSVFFRYQETQELGS